MAPRLYALNTDVHVAMDAVGAGRMFLDPRSRWLTVEVVEWRRDLDTLGRLDTPPVLRTVEIGERSDDLVVNGWRLAGPFEDGTIAYVAEKEAPFRFWVASSRDKSAGRQLELPEGSWVMGGTTQAGNLGVVVMAQRNELRYAPVNWIAAVDPVTLNVVASTRRDVTLARINLDQRLTGVAGANRQPRMVLLSYVGTGWKVEAVDVDSMATAWEATLAITDPNPEGLLGISGDDAYVLVALGRGGREGVSVSDAFVLDLKTGKELRSMKKLALHDDVVQVVPVPDRPSVALLYRYEIGSHNPPPREGFSGVTEFDLSTGSERVVSEASLGSEDFKNLRLLDARSIVMGPFGLVLAPRSEAAALQFGSAYRPRWLVDDGGEGRERASVRSLVTTPSEWHRREPAMP